jgi:hypothetical protein
MMYKGGSAPRGPHPRRGGRGGYQPGRGRCARSGAGRASMSDDSTAAGETASTTETPVADDQAETPAQAAADE